MDILDNKEFLNKAVMEPYDLDEYVRLVANAKFRQIDEAGIESLYTSGTIDLKNKKCKKTA